MSTSRFFSEYRPEAGSLYVRFVPRQWPQAASLWTNVVARTVGRCRVGSAVTSYPLPPPAAFRELDDVLLLPPVPSGAGALAERGRRMASEAGVPTWEQWLAGDERWERFARPVHVSAVIDLLPLLLGRCAPPSPAAETDIALLPLVPGLSGARESWTVLLESLRPRGWRRVVPLSMGLDGRQRREIYDAAGELADYQALFHGGEPDPSAFEEVARELGLDPVVERPLPSGPPGLVTKRRVAGVLLDLAEREERAGGSESRAQRWYAAARWIDDTSYDLRALWQDGHLQRVPELRGLEQTLTEILGHGVGATGR